MGKVAIVFLRSDEIYPGTSQMAGSSSGVRRSVSVTSRIFALDEGEAQAETRCRPPSIFEIDKVQLFKGMSSFVFSSPA